jgi:ZIP family zinc transporter
MTALLVMTIAVGASAATMLGGLAALGFRERLHLVLGFSAGAVIAVAFFDLLPEALSLGAHSPRAIVTAAALGFFLYLLFDRLISLRGADQSTNDSPWRGRIGASSFSAHSLLDGFAIGIAFQAGQAVGFVVAAAVLVHDFSDGLNTVNVVVKNGGRRASALAWLVVDAAAPLLGAALSLLIAPPRDVLGLLLAGFSGFFLYIGASDLLPESQRAFPRLWTTIATLLGAALLYFATQLAL